MITRLNIGDVVMVTARDEFYAFIDGWRGRVSGFQAGCAEIKCARPDGEKVFYVPPEQLILSVLPL